jgi:hypothetical protein
MFTLQEIGQMVCEICSNLERQLNVDLSTLRDFESRVHHDFAGPGPPQLLYCLKPRLPLLLHPSNSVHPSVRTSRLRGAKRFTSHHLHGHPH